MKLSEREINEIKRKACTIGIVSGFIMGALTVIAIAAALHYF